MNTNVVRGMEAVRHKYCRKYGPSKCERRESMILLNVNGVKGIVAVRHKYCKRYEAYSR